MKCIAVYPILKTTFSEMLTYWTTFDYKTGDLIQVPLQSRKVWAIVDAVLSVSEAKEFIKSQSFAIRKITERVTSDFFSHEFILSCLHASRYYMVPFGEVISEVVPKHVLMQMEGNDLLTKARKSSGMFSLSHIQNTFANRMERIQDMLNSRKNGYVCIIAPTVETATHISAHLKKSSDSPVRLLHGSLTPKKQKELLSGDGVIVMTPIYLYLLDRLDIDTVILEYAGSDYYRHLRKRVDFRYVVRQYAERKGLALIESDALLPVYAEVLEASPDVSYALPRTPDTHIIDQAEVSKAKVRQLAISKKQRPEDMADVREIIGLRTEILTHKKLELVTPELFSLIKYCEKHKKSVMLYTVRKGLSTQIVCKDCQSVYACPECRKPYQIKVIAGRKTYVCPTGHASQPINSVCPNCAGIHLRLIGCGTEAIAKELSGTTTLPIEIVDGDVSTPAKARKLLGHYQEKKLPAIFVGTELLLNQSHERLFEYTAIVSLETLLALPHQFAEIEAARVVNAMLERTSESLLIQTRTRTHGIWGCVARKDWKPLVDQAHRDAMELKLPPFSVHIQVYVPLTYEKRRNEATTIAAHLRQFGTVQTHGAVDKEVMHLFMRVDAWPDEMLLSYLKSLPSYMRVEVDSPYLL